MRKRSDSASLIRCLQHTLEHVIHKVIWHGNPAKLARCLLLQAHTTLPKNGHLNPCFKSGFQEHSVTCITCFCKLGLQNCKLAMAIQECICNSPFQVPQWGDPCGSPSHPPSDPQGRSMFTVSGPSNKINVSNHPGISCSDKDSSSWHRRSSTALKLASKTRSAQNSASLARAPWECFAAKRLSDPKVHFNFCIHIQSC